MFRKRVNLQVLALAALVMTKPALAQEGLTEICGGCRVEKVATCGGFLEGATIAPDGDLWVMDVSGDRILEISEGECIERGKAGGLPNGAQFTTDGDLLIAAGSGLVSFDTQSGAITPVLTEIDGEPLSSPNDIALDSAGGVYVTEVRGSSLFNPVGRVLYLPPDRSEPQFLADTIAFPNGITIAPDGRSLLVSEFGSQRIVSITLPQAGPQFRMAYVYANISGGVGADGIQVDHKGRLYTAQIGAGLVQVFDDKGRELGIITLPEGAGAAVTNFALSDEGYLYITEAGLGEVWGVQLID